MSRPSRGGVQVQLASIPNLVDNCFDRRLPLLPRAVGSIQEFHHILSAAIFYSRY